MLGLICYHWPTLATNVEYHKKRREDFIIVETIARHHKNTHPLSHMMSHRGGDDQESKHNHLATNQPLC